MLSVRRPTGHPLSLCSMWQTPPFHVAPSVCLESESFLPQRRAWRLRMGSGHVRPYPSEMSPSGSRKRPVPAKQTDPQAASAGLRQAKANRTVGPSASGWPPQRYINSVNLHESTSEVLLLAPLYRRGKGPQRCPTPTALGLRAPTAERRTCSTLSYTAPLWQKQRGGCLDPARSAVGTGRICALEVSSSSLESDFISSTDGCSATHLLSLQS